MSFINQLKMLERMHQLIKMQATGTPKEFSEKFEISQSRLYDYLNTLKEMGGKIEYSRFSQSYMYTEEVHFQIGFSCLQSMEITGG